MEEVVGWGVIPSECGMRILPATEARLIRMGIIEWGHQEWAQFPKRLAVSGWGDAFNRNPPPLQLKNAPLQLFNNYRYVKTHLCLIFPSIWLLKTWNNGLTTGLLSIFMHVNQGCTRRQSFPRTILGGTDFPLSLSVAWWSLDKVPVTCLSIPGKTSFVLFYTFLEASKSITILLSFLGFHTRREIREIVSVIVRGSEPSPLWSLLWVVSQKHIHYIILVPCARSSPSSAIQHLQPSKGGRCQTFHT